jgi:tyrosinase
MTVVAPTPGRSERARIKLRRSATKLDADWYDNFRNVIREALRRRDERGYQYFAGWHGVPFAWCWHGNPRFLPWHRAYLYYFELALQDIDASVTLPWWDWATSEKIPRPYALRRVDRKANPLFSVPIEPMTGRRDPSWPRRTSRAVGSLPLALPPPWKDRWDWALGAPTFTEFDRRISLIHGNVHVWVAGTMGEVDWAAYDPIFWAHHAMVDRAWRIWQHGHPGSNPPANILDEPLEPNGMTVRQTLDVKQLGYDYAGTAARVPGTRPGGNS